MAISAGRVSLPDNGKSCGGRPGPSAAVTSLSVESSAADNGQECLLIRFKRNKKKKRAELKRKMSKLATCDSSNKRHGRQLLCNL